MGAPEDPFASLPRWERLGLRRRLRRSWADGLAERRAASLARLRTDLHGAAVVTADYRGATSEIVFADGTTVGLWSCHKPAVRALRTAARDGDVRLVRADHHGHCWALYFVSLEGRLPVICRELYVRNHHGGLATPAMAPLDSAPQPA